MRLAFPLLVVAALSLTSPALAKDLTKAQACGESGCVALPRDENGDGLIQLRGSEGRPPAPPPKAAPYYTLNWEFGRPSKDGPSVRFVTLYVPSADLVAAPGMDLGSIEWFGASKRVLEKVRAAVRNLEPFAAPKRWQPEIFTATQLSSPPSSEGRARTNWLLAGSASLLALAIAAFSARRLRVRRLRPAA